jgi:hypothetical protein
VHHRTIQINHQPDATIFQFIILTFIYISTQHYYHHGMKVKPEAATAVIKLLMMGGKTPETCLAVNKRQDNKLENCCIWLVIYLKFIYVPTVLSGFNDTSYQCSDSTAPKQTGQRSLSSRAYCEFHALLVGYFQNRDVSNRTR